MTEPATPTAATTTPAATPPSTTGSPPPASSPAPAAAGSPPDAAATAKPADKTQLLFEQPKTGDKPGEPPKADAKPGDKPEDGKTEKGKDDKAEAVVTTVADLVFPEDQPLPDDMKDEVNAFMKDNNLSKEQAQKLVGLQTKLNEKNLDYWMQTKETWRNEIINDPVLGGKNLDKTVADANSVIRKYGDDELKDDLVLLGLGNKRSFVRFLGKINEKTKNDSIEGAGNAGGDAKKAPENVLWPNMK